MTFHPDYDVVVVGGGPAGLTTAVYTTRLGHRTALVDGSGGRQESVAHVHNVIGVAESTSGAELGELAVDQFQEYGGDYYDDAVEDVVVMDDNAESSERDAEDGERSAGDGERDMRGEASGAGFGGASERRFRVDAAQSTLYGDRVVLATGFSDESPGVPGLRQFTGRGLHYCLHCDAYTLGDERVYVLGHDDHAAHAALVMLNFTADVDLLLNGERPTWGDAYDEQVRRLPIDLVSQSVDGAFPADETDENSWLGGFEFVDGAIREYAGGFAMYGRAYNNRLARDLGCECHDDGSVAVDGTRQTSVDGVYAAGDLTHGQNQTPIAMGDGAYAGIAVHKSLRTFPLDADELGALDGDDAGDEFGTISDGRLNVPSTPDDLRARMRRNRERGTISGMHPHDGV